MTEHKPKRPPVDWEAIEREYRAGQLSLREIGRQHSVTEGAIRKKAKAEGWTRPLADKVREAVREKLVRSDGTQEGTQRAHPSDAEAIELAAARGVAVVREHRKLIAKGKDAVDRLLDELSDTILHRDEIEEDIEAECEGDKTTERRNRMLRAVSLNSRAGTAFTLSGAMKNLLGLDRQAFNLSDSADGDTSGVTVELVRFSE